MSDDLTDEQRADLVRKAQVRALAAKLAHVSLPGDRSKGIAPMNWVLIAGADRLAEHLVDQGWQNPAISFDDVSSADLRHSRDRAAARSIFGPLSPSTPGTDQSTRQAPADRQAVWPPVSPPRPRDGDGGQ